MIDQPRLRLEVEGMKYSVMTILQDHFHDLGGEVNKAVADYCKADNLIDIINQQVQHSVDKAIQDEIRDFYRYGKGREAIKKAVELTLGDQE